MVIFGLRNFSIVLDFVPIIGNIKRLAETVTGKNLITGEELSTGGRRIRLSKRGYGVVEKLL